MNQRAVRIPLQGEMLLGVLHDAAACQDGGDGTLGVVIVVGGPQYRVGSHRQFVTTARFLAARGYPVLRFDYRGMGDSTGSSPGFEHVQEDVRAAIDALYRERPEVRSICLYGLCDAASAVLLYCSSDPRVSALVLVNPWVRTEAGHAAAIVKHYYGQRLLQWGFWRKLLRGGLNPVVALQSLLASVRNSRGAGNARQDYIAGMREGLTRFRGPVLLLSSGRDLTAREFDDLCSRDGNWASAIAGASLKRMDLPSADHTFSVREALEAANAATTDFLASGRNAGMRSGSHSSS